MLGRLWREWRGVVVHQSRPECVWERSVLSAAEFGQAVDADWYAAARRLREQRAARQILETARRQGAGRIPVSGGGR